MKIIKHVGIVLETKWRCGHVSSSFIDVERIRAVIINEVWLAQPVLILSEAAVNCLHLLDAFTGRHHNRCAGLSSICHVQQRRHGCGILGKLFSYHSMTALLNPCVGNYCKWFILWVVQTNCCQWDLDRCQQTLPFLLQCPLQRTNYLLVVQTLLPGLTILQPVYREVHALVGWTRGDALALALLTTSMSSVDPVQRILCAACMAVSQHPACVVPFSIIIFEMVMKCC